MILADLTSDKADIQGASPSDTFGFGMANPKVIFSILRERMYSNPRKAAIQEYMCNARDAHREAGIEDRPIEITFPEFDSSEIYIRDFGLGIPREMMEKVFCQYGESTKRSSDRFTGGWGLGCKTGFAIGDSFSVRSVTNDPDGRRISRLYLAYLDESAGGSMSMLAEEETTDETGLQIQLPIDIGKTQEFAKYVETTAELWKVKPIIHRWTIIWPEPSYYLKGSNWAVEEAKYGATSSIVLDGIKYRFRTDTLEDMSLSVGAQSFLSKPFVLFFETGELTPTPNREDITYDQSAKYLIAERLEEIVREFAETMAKRMDEIFSAKKDPFYYRELFNSNRREMETYAPDLLKKYGELLISERITALHHGMRVWHYKHCQTYSDQCSVETGREVDQMGINKNAIYIEDDTPGKEPTRQRIYGMISAYGDDNSGFPMAQETYHINAIYAIRFHNAEHRARFFANEPGIAGLIASRKLSEFTPKMVNSKRTQAPRRSGGEDIRLLSRDLVKTDGFYGGFAQFRDFDLAKVQGSKNVPIEDYTKPPMTLDDISGGIVLYLRNGKVYEVDGRDYKVKGENKKRTSVNLPDGFEVSLNDLAHIPEDIPIFGVFDKGFQKICENPKFIGPSTYLYKRKCRLEEKMGDAFQNGRIYYYPFNQKCFSSLGGNIGGTYMAQLLRDAPIHMLPYPELREWHRFVNKHRGIAKFITEYIKVTQSDDRTVEMQISIPDDNRLKWLGLCLVSGDMSDAQKLRFLSMLNTNFLKHTITRKRK